MSEEAAVPKEYEITRENKIGRLKERGRYDWKTVHSIAREAPVLHVSFSDIDGTPACIPMIGAIIENEETEEVYIYLHGHAKSRLAQMLPPSTLVCITASIVDGIVFALSAFHHDMNYRCSIFHCEVVAFESEEERWVCAQHIVDSTAEGRYEGSRKPNDAEMKSTGFVKLKVLSASAKCKSGPPGDDAVDINDTEMTARVWTGVIPTRRVFDTPIPAEINKCPELPEGIKKLIAGP